MNRMASEIPASDELSKAAPAHEGLDPDATLAMESQGTATGPPAPRAGGGEEPPTLVERVVQQVVQHLQRSGIKLHISSQSPFRAALEQLGQTSPGNFYASHYSVHGTVGQGGIGRVFLAHDQALGREVAIKELLPCKDLRDLPRRLNRFVREVRITGQLEHPGVVPVYEVGLREDGTLYYVMKYVRGKTMQAAIDEACARPPDEAQGERLKLLNPLIAVCEAMSYAHSRGVVHRDLKPDNIILGEFGETIILDWGLAKVQRPWQSESPDDASPGVSRLGPAMAGMTVDGEILGTPAFMAPEQVDSRFGEVNARTDVYALGTILYDLLTGVLPYQGDIAVMLARVSDGRPSPSPRERSGNLPPELVAICEKAMNKDQAERFEHAGCMAEQLRAYRDGRVVSVYAYSPRELFRRFVARNKTMLLAGMVAILALLIGAGLAVHWALRADAARQRAIEEHGRAERARMRAEQAVEGVASLANDLQRMADQTAASLNESLERLTDALRVTAEAIGGDDLTDRAVMRPYLVALRKRFPQCESFWTVTPPGMLAAVEPQSYEKSLGTDVTHQEHIRWVFQHQKPVFSRIFQLVEEENSYAVSLQVPVFHDGRMVGTLATVLRPDRVIPVLIPEPLRLDKAARLWCIQEDGYVLYDNDLNQIGSYLFKDQTCAQYPELRRFAEQMMKDKTGVGYFRRPAPTGDRMVERVAAWETLRPSETTRWKIVVVKPYEVGD